MTRIGQHGPARPYFDLPKVELHLHMDCCLSYQAARSLSPGLSEAEYRKTFVGDAQIDGLQSFLRCTQSHLDLLQTKTGLIACVDDLATQLEDDNVIYAELRFAPLQHLSAGLSPESVVDIVVSRIKEIKRHSPVEMKVILCALWHQSAAQSLRTLHLIRDAIGDGVVVGFDIAGNEAFEDRCRHYPTLLEANRLSIPLTLHAGEALGAESVWQAFAVFSPARIGHGIHAVTDRHLVQRLAASGVHLELCPSCNLQLGYCATMADHPIEEFYQSGVSVGISTDQRAITPTTLCEEYEKISRAFSHWTERDFVNCNRNALAAAFCDDVTRAKLFECLK